MCEWVKIQVITESELDHMGLPIYDYAHIQKSNLRFEEQTCFSVSCFNQNLYQDEVERTLKRNGAGWYMSNQMPDPEDNKFWVHGGVVKRSVTNQERVNGSVKKYFICGYPVCEEEYRKVGKFVGCEL